VGVHRTGLPDAPLTVREQPLPAIGEPEIDGAAAALTSDQAALLHPEKDRTRRVLGDPEARHHREDARLGHEDRSPEDVPAQQGEEQSLRFDCGGDDRARVVGPLFTHAGILVVFWQILCGCKNNSDIGIQSDTT
jgi:hypothetical protein